MRTILGGSTGQHLVGPGTLVAVVLSLLLLRAAAEQLLHGGSPVSSNNFDMRGTFQLVGIVLNISITCP